MSRAKNVDRSGRSCVGRVMVRAGLAGLLLAAVACGGGQKQKTTTPQVSGKAPAAPVNPDEQGASLYTGGADEAMPLAPEPKAPAPEPAAAPEPKEVAGLPKPPTQDLPKDKREQLVREQLRRGIEALRARDSDGMIRAARAALDVDESNVEAMIMLAHGNYLKGYDDKAEAVLNLARKQRAGEAHPVLHMILGLVYDRTNREDLALTEYEKATQLKPDYLAALTNRGAIYLKRKRYNDAIAVFEQVVQIHSRSPRAHTNLGSAYRGRSADLVEQRDQRDQLLRRAEQEFRLAMTQNASYAPAYFNMGILYLDADPFPGMDTMQRLAQASKFLADYKRHAGPAGVPVVDDYLAAAQKGIEREQKLQNAKKKRDAAKRPGGGS